MKIYRIVDTDGRVKVVRMKKAAELETLQKWVGGYIEQVKLSTGHYAYVNEEGRLRGLPQNKAFDQLCGNVVVLQRGHRR